MKLAFLFAGQGSQKKGMGADLYQDFPAFQKTLDSLELDFDLKQTMFEDPGNVINQTRYTQPCMAAFAAGVTAVLREAGIKPAMTAGLSLGEYSALEAAGVFDAETLVDLVNFRGKEIKKAAEGIECRMSAVLGLDREKLEQVCAEVMTELQSGNINALSSVEKDTDKAELVTISNYNCPGQYVLGGSVRAVELAEAKAKEAGAKRCMPLKVSGPFHTAYMKPAGDALAAYFQKMTWNDMEMPVVFNLTGTILQAGETIPELLEKQVQCSVRMEDCIKTLEANGIDTIVEIGPGKALSGFVKRTAPDIRCMAIEDTAGLQAVLDELQPLFNKEEA
ncbi:MAG: ACP S-malonyltransferase [Lachnospiraceae bacterium]|nr:ACP S-malonyltransferase [Lachnospiraceae bacterium]